MIPIPKCKWSSQNAYKLCLSSTCQAYPFICGHCQNQHCLNIHTHHTQIFVKLWSDLASLIQKKYRQQSCWSKQQIIYYLEYKNYKDITGKKLRALYDSLESKSNDGKYLKFQLRINQSLKDQEILQRGIDKFDQKLFQSAYSDFQKVISSDVNCYKAYTYLVKIIKKLNQLQKYIVKYSQKINSDLNNPILYYTRARLYIQDLKFEQALCDFSKAIQLNSKYYIAYNARANLLVEMGRIQNALIDYDQSLNLNPKYFSTYCGRANLFQKLGKYDLALNDFNRAIEINPNDSNIYVNRGLLYSKLNETELEFQDYNKAIELNAQNFEAYYNRALSYQANGEFQKALDDYTKAIQYNPKHVQSYYNRGGIYLEFKQYELALKDSNKAIELDPQHFRAYYNRGLLNEKMKLSDMAFEDYNKVIELNSTYEKAYFNRALIFKKKCRILQAIQDLDKCVDLNPDYPRTYANRGNLKFEIGNFDSALCDFLKYIQLGGCGGCIHKVFFHTGRIYLIYQKFELAQFYFSKAIQQYRDKSEYYLYRAVLRQKLGMMEQAEDDYNILFNQFDENDSSLNKLKLIYSIAEKQLPNL